MIGRLGAELDRLTSGLNEQLAHQPDDRLLTAAGDAVMRLDTRTVELTIHSDDLAVSVGVTAPALPPDALDSTLATLVAIGRARHGDLAILPTQSVREAQ